MMKDRFERSESAQSHEQIIHRLRRAEEMIAAHDYARAAELFRQLIHQMSPEAGMRGEWERAYVGLSKCHTALGSSHDLIPLLKKALRVIPGSEVLVCLLAESYARQNQFRRAERELVRGMNRGCRGPLLHRCLAELFLQQGKLDEAIAECLRSLEQDVSQEAVYELLAEAYLRRSQHDEAVAALQGALANNPNEPRYYLEIADIYRQQDATEQAVAILREGRSRCPESIEIAEVLLECLSDLRETDALIEEATAIHQQEPTNLFALEVLAFAYMQKGEINSAEAVLRLALTIAPFDTLNRLKLASLYHQQGDFCRAREEYQRVLGANPPASIREDVQRALDAIDEYQLQQIAMLVTENPTFRVKLNRDIESALREYSFCLSESSMEYLRAMLMNGLMDGGYLRHGGTIH